MDGFMKGSSSSGASQTNIPKITEASNLLIPKGASNKLRTAAQGVHNRAQRSQTLMRTAVKKPANLAKTVNSGVRQAQADIKRPKAPQIDRSRMSRVQAINKNSNVRRFGHAVHAPAASKAAPHKAPAKVEQAEVVSRPAARQTAASTTSSSTSLIHKPLPSLITSASHQQLERMLDEALTRADAHKRGHAGRLPNQSLLQKVKSMPRWLSLGSALAVAIIAAVFIAVNKVPAIAVRVASAKAHIHAELPGYTPSGFSFSGPVSYSDGKVSIQFKANDSSNRQFTISQSGSKMSSKSLEDNVVPDNTQVQTSIVNGTTVYIYGQNNDAAWVNNGMKYVVKDAASLNSDQLLKIASSLN
jgi:hypothetical protein